jgi:hypothetical protein
MILSLDIATACGWAIVALDGHVVTSGAWQLASHDVGRRVNDLRERIAVHTPPVTIVAYESLRFSGAADAAHHWGALWGVVRGVIADRGLPYLEVTPATWKRAAGLRSNSGPDAALAAARSRWPEDGIRSEDEAVARWVGVVAASRVSGTRGARA